MTTDLAEFRERIGLMPGARLALLRSLLGGPSALEDLVQVSALPRRDVEDFVTSLDGIELDEGGQRYLLSARSRGGYQRLLDEFTAQRRLLSASDEDQLRGIAEELIAGVPAPRKRFDHVQATPRTLVRRVKWLTENFELGSRSVLFLGDHDLTSLLLARVAAGARLTVADIDERLLAYIEDRARAPGLVSRVDCVFADLRFGLPPALAGGADVVFTDPPYTAEGLSLFLSRSIAGAKRQNPDTRIVIAFGHSRRRPDLGLAAQREMLRSETVIDCMIPYFNTYFGAQAVGSASDLYSCQPTPRAFRRFDQGTALDGQHGIYTHGDHSVESSARHRPGISELLPDIVPPGTAGPGGVGLVALAPGAAPEFGVAVSLGQLLASGVHPAVTRRAGEFVVDLRDDPGPWLMRSLLALNGKASVLVLRKPHDGLAELTAGSRAWDLVRAKFSSFSVRDLHRDSLVTVRCELGDVWEAGGELALARFILQRAHGRLRNVWREGLIEIAKRAGKTLSKREAAELVEAHAGSYRGDLALRLVDVPAHHFDGLRGAFAGSAADLASG